jgi:hypothetical protein
MELADSSVAMPNTVKARPPLLQTKRQLPFAGTPKRKKSSSSSKKGAKSEGCNMVEDFSSSDEDIASKNPVVSTKMAAHMGNKEMMAKVAALHKQMEEIQVEILNKHLAAISVITKVKSDLFMVATQV